LAHSTLKSKASQNDYKEDLYEKIGRRLEFFMKRDAPQARLIKQNAPHARFLTES